jgi:hypothetical protein
MSVGLMNQIGPVTPIIILLMGKKNARGAHPGAHGSGKGKRREKERETTEHEGDIHLQVQGADGGQDTDSIIQGASQLFGISQG